MRAAARWQFYTAKAGIERFLRHCSTCEASGVGASSRQSQHAPLPCGVVQQAAGGWRSPFPKLCQALESLPVSAACLGTNGWEVIPICLLRRVECQSCAPLCIFLRSGIQGVIFRSDRA
jgi:hypothetical protein